MNKNGGVKVNMAVSMPQLEGISSIIFYFIDKIRSRSNSIRNSRVSRIFARLGFIVALVILMIKIPKYIVELAKSIPIKPIQVLMYTFSLVWAVPLLFLSFVILCEVVALYLEIPFELNDFFSVLFPHFYGPTKTTSVAKKRNYSCFYMNDSSFTCEPTSRLGQRSSVINSTSDYCMIPSNGNISSQIDGPILTANGQRCYSRSQQIISSNNTNKYSGRYVQGSSGNCNIYQQQHSADSRYLCNSNNLQCSQTACENYLTLNENNSIDNELLLPLVKKSGKPIIVRNRNATVKPCSADNINQRRLYVNNTAENFAISNDDSNRRNRTVDNRNMNDGLLNDIQSKNIAENTANSTLDRNNINRNSKDPRNNNTLSFTYNGGNEPGVDNYAYTPSNLVVTNNSGLFNEVPKSNSVGVQDSARTATLSSYVHEPYSDKKSLSDITAEEKIKNLQKEFSGNDHKEKIGRRKKKRRDQETSPTISTSSKERSIKSRGVDKSIQRNLNDLRHNASKLHERNQAAIKNLQKNAALMNSNGKRGEPAKQNEVMRYSEYSRMEFPQKNLDKIERTLLQSLNEGFY